MGDGGGGSKFVSGGGLNSSLQGRRVLGRNILCMRLPSSYQNYKNCKPKINASSSSPPLDFPIQLKLNYLTRFCDKLLAL